jgi:hypothetical protein
VVGVRGIEPRVHAPKACCRPSTYTPKVGGAGSVVVLVITPTPYGATAEIRTGGGQLMRLT